MNGTIKARCEQGHDVTAWITTVEGQTMLTLDEERHGWAPCVGEGYGYTYGGCCWRAAVDAALAGPRLDLVAHIREQLAQGRYCTEGKLRIVAERVAEELEGEA